MDGEIQKFQTIVAVAQIVPATLAVKIDSVPPKILVIDQSVETIETAHEAISVQKAFVVEDVKKKTIAKVWANLVDVIEAFVFQKKIQTTKNAPVTKIVAAIVFVQVDSAKKDVALTHLAKKVTFVEVLFAKKAARATTIVHLLKVVTLVHVKAESAKLIATAKKAKSVRQQAANV